MDENQPDSPQILAPNLPAGPNHAPIHRHRAGLNTGNLLLLAALVIYLVTRLVGLEDYPIYFFTDEAAQTVLAQDLVNNGWSNAEGDFLPTYFYNGYQYNLSLSVYAQVIPTLLFGKSIFVTRASAALITLAAAIFSALIMKNIFRSRYAWLAVLCLAATPAWFLHSRTAFETTLAVSMYTGFLYFYLMYRMRSPQYLYAAVLFAGLTFYSYSPARMVIGLSGILLFFSDLRYHWQNRKTVLQAAILLAVLAIPFVRFLYQHPGENLKHLHTLNSYWIKAIPLQKKLAHYASQYTWGLSPIYWFSPTNPDMARHVMGSYGHQMAVFLPFCLAGFMLCLRKIGKPEYRAVLISFLAAPSGAALVEIGITRALVMVIPLTIFTTMGMSLLLEWLEKRLSIAQRLPAMITTLALILLSMWITADALKNGPTWETNYGLDGMQYGAKQVFGAIAEELKARPGQKIILSPSWANGTDTTAAFFFEDPLPFEIGSIEGYSTSYRAMDENPLFIMIPEEYKEIRENEKFTGIQVIRTLPYPDGENGFYFIHLLYSDKAEGIFLNEQAARRVLQEKQVELEDGTAIQVKYSYLDMGKIEEIFDGDADTVIRTMEANPLVVQVSFPQPRCIRFIRLKIGGNPSLVEAEVGDENDKIIQRLTRNYEETSDPRLVKLELSGQEAGSILIKITTQYSPEPSHVHLWEVYFDES